MTLEELQRYLTGLPSPTSETVVNPKTGVVTQVPARTDEQLLAEWLKLPTASTTPATTPASSAPAASQAATSAARGLPVVDSAAGVRSTPVVDSAAGVRPAPAPTAPAAPVPAPEAQAPIPSTAYEYYPIPFRQPTPCEAGLNCNNYDLEMRRGFASSRWRDQQGMPMSMAETLATAGMLAPGMQNINAAMQGADQMMANQTFSDPTINQRAQYYQDAGLDYASAMLRARSDILGDMGQQRAQLGMIAPQQAAAADAVAQRNMAQAAAFGLDYYAPQTLPGYIPYGVTQSTVGDAGRSTVLEQLGIVNDPSADPMLPAAAMMAGQYGPAWVQQRDDELQALRRALSGVGQVSPVQQALIAQRLAAAENSLSRAEVNRQRAASSGIGELGITVR